MATSRTVKTITDDVKAIIDEIVPNESELFGQDSDQANLTAVIESKIEDAIRHIYLVADEQFLEPTEVTGSVYSAKTVSDGEMSSYYIEVTVPSTFLRLVSAQAENWIYPATELIAQSDSRYPMLFNPYSTGTKERPRIGMKGARTLQFFGCEAGKTGGFKYEYNYVAMPSKASYGYLIYDNLYRPILYYIAGLTLMTMRDDHASTLLDMGLIEAGVNTSEQKQ